MMDGPITSVNLFTLSSRPAGEFNLYVHLCSGLINIKYATQADREDVELLGSYHVIVSSAVELALVFM